MGYEKKVAQLIQDKKYADAAALCAKAQNEHPELADNFFYLTAMGACAYGSGNNRAGEFCFRKAFALKGK